MCLLYFYGLHTNYYTDDISGTFAKVEGNLTKQTGSRRLKRPSNEDRRNKVKHMNMIKLQRAEFKETLKK